MREYMPVQPPSLQSGLQNSHYRYCEFQPSKALKPYVACYWTIDVEAFGRGVMHRILPDGCIDLIFDLKERSTPKGAFVTGLMPAFEAFELIGDFSMFGIRFFAEAARRLIVYPVAELSGHRVFLDELWGKAAGPIVEEVQTASSAAEIIDRVEVMLMKQLQRYNSSSDRLLESGMRYIYASQGRLSIRSLAEKLGYSERNVRRIFRDELGAGPKQLIDIVRFQFLLQELQQRTSFRFADVAVKYGYYDQSHLIRGFKQYYGLSPNEVFKSNSSVFYNR